MDAKQVKSKAIRVAHANPGLRDQLLPLIKQATGKRVLTASQRWDLIEAIKIAKGMDIEAAATAIDKMPGFSPMQLRQQIDRVASVHRELEIMQERLKDEIAKMKGLEDEEKEGLDILKKAAGQMKEKGQYCADTEKALLQFTAYTQEKRPGIEQMIAKPEDTKWGEKAGDLFGRVAAKLGDTVAAEVEVLYRQCEEDLTHTAMAVKGLKVISKTSSLHPTIVKNAGLADTLIDLKEWLGGKTNAVAQKIIGFMGDIKRWFKGFVERTKIAEKSKNTIVNALKDAEKEADKLLAGA